MARKHSPRLLLKRTRAGEAIESPLPQRRRKPRLGVTRLGNLREASASWLCWTPLQPPPGTPSKCPRPLWGTGFLACLCPSFLKLAALCSPPAHVHRSVLGASVLVHMKSGWEKGA